LWWIDGNPPHGKVKACSTENGFSPTQVLGRFTGCQPNLKTKCIAKLPFGLWVKQTHAQVSSQHDAPHSEAA